MRDADAAVPDRPRAVPDAPVASVAAGTGLAKAWLLALIGDAPLDAVARVALDRFAGEAPGLCAAVVAAVADDSALGRLEPGGDLAGAAAGAAALTGATRPADAVVAVDALRRVAWRALAGELRRPDAVLLTALADRLSHVASVVAAASADAAASAEPVLRDARAGLLDDIARRHREEGVPYAALDVALDDLERLRAAHPAEDVAGAARAVGQALAGAVPSEAVVAAEGPGRWRVVLPGADRGAAGEVAAAVAAAAEPAPVLGGAPLRVVVGTATCPDDGTDPAGLLEVAEGRRLAAEAAGVALADA